MTFFEAVFYPFAIWALLGVAAAVVPYFLPALREKKKWPIACFILIAFLVMLFWRMGMSVGKRHQMTLFVPAILLAVYFFFFYSGSRIAEKIFSSLLLDFSGVVSDLPLHMYGKVSPSSGKTVSG